MKLEQENGDEDGNGDEDENRDEDENGNEDENGDEHGQDNEEFNSDENDFVDFDNMVVENVVEFVIDADSGTLRQVSNDEKSTTEVLDDFDINANETGDKDKENNMDDNTDDSEVFNGEHLYFKKLRCGNL